MKNAMGKDKFCKNVVNPTINYNLVLINLQNDESKNKYLQFLDRRLPRLTLCYIGKGTKLPKIISVIIVTESKTLILLGMSKLEGRSQDTAH